MLSEKSTYVWPSVTSMSRGLKGADKPLHRYGYHRMLTTSHGSAYRSLDWHPTGQSLSILRQHTACIERWPEMPHDAASGTPRHSNDAPAVKLLLHSIKEELADDVGLLGALLGCMLLSHSLLQLLLAPIFHSLISLPPAVRKYVEYLRSDGQTSSHCSLIAKIQGRLYGCRVVTDGAEQLLHALQLPRYECAGNVLGLKLGIQLQKLQLQSPQALLIDGKLCDMMH